MKFSLPHRTKKLSKMIGENGYPLDRNKWKDSQEMQQLYNVTMRTLQRWRDEKAIEFYRFKRQIYYNNEKFRKKFKKNAAAPRKIQILNSPVSLLWLSVIVVEAVIFVFVQSYYARIIAMAIPLIIAVPAQIVISIQRIQKRKKS